MSIKKKEVEVLSVILFSLFSLLSEFSYDSTENIVYNYDDVRLKAANIEKVVIEEEIVEEVDTFNYDLANAIVSKAVQYVGYPYVYGGNSLTSGTDCSGFTMLIYRQFGISLPRSAYEQLFVGVSVDINDIKVGDLVLSGYNGKTHHVAIYIGDGKIVHALNESVGIVITSMYNMPITGIRRVI